MKISLQEVIGIIVSCTKTLLNIKNAKKLSDLTVNPKLCWTLLKILLNGRKIHCIPPLFHDKNL